MATTVNFTRGRGGARQLRIDLGRHPLRERNSIKYALSDIAHGQGDILVLQANPRVVELLGELIPDLELEPDVSKWYHARLAWEDKRKDLKKNAPMYMPEVGAHDQLWPFQRQGVSYLAQVNRALLCDEPGLGKTAQVIVTMRLVEGSDHTNPKALVICPKHLRGFWEQEIYKWWDPPVHPKVTLCEAAMRDVDFLIYKQYGGIFIVNWELLRLMPELQHGGWKWIVADEAHRVKNRKTKTWQAFKKLNAPRVILMTATPFANNASEVWTLLNYVRPDEYSSFWRFYDMYVHWKTSYLGFKQVLGVRNPKLLQRELAPYMLRRLKVDVAADLPEKIHTTIPLGLTPRQRSLYRDLRQEAIALLESGVELTVVNAISLMTRLRQIVSTTATLEATDHSTKLDAAVELIQDLAPEKVVVFAQFRNTVDALCARLDRAKVSNLKMMGGMGAEHVDSVVKGFQEEDARVLVATMATGGEGLTLTAANTLMFIEKHYNPARQLQAEDRIHRIGQTKTCNIISLHCNRTVDDTVARILSRKEEDFNKVLVEQLIEDLYDLEV